MQLYTSLTYGGAGTPRRVKDEITSLLRASNQTWMDVVKEGQRSALKDIPSSLDEAAIKKELGSSMQEGAQAFKAVGKQLIDIIEEALREPSDRIQQ